VRPRRDLKEQTRKKGGQVNAHGGKGGLEEDMLKTTKRNNWKGLLKKEEPKEENGDRR